MLILYVDPAGAGFQSVLVELHKRHQHAHVITTDLALMQQSITQIGLHLADICDSELGSSFIEWWKPRVIRDNCIPTILLGQLIRNRDDVLVVAWRDEDLSAAKELKLDTFLIEDEQDVQRLTAA